MSLYGHIFDGCHRDKTYDPVEECKGLNHLCSGGNHVKPSVQVAVLRLNRLHFAHIACWIGLTATGLTGCGVQRHNNADGTQALPAAAPENEPNESLLQSSAWGSPAATFEDIEFELFAEIQRLTDGGTAMFIGEVIEFARTMRGVSRDADREEMANRILRKKNAFEYFAVYRAMYLFGLKERRLANDAGRDAFAERIAKREHPTEVAAIWMDAYRFARETRRLRQDNYGEMFVDSVLKSSKPRTFWKEYRAAYLVALNNRRFTREDLCDAFARRIANLAVKREEAGENGDGHGGGDGGGNGGGNGGGDGIILPPIPGGGGRSSSS